MINPINIFLMAVFTLIALCILVGLVFLQLLLCKKEMWKATFIIPAIFFVISIVILIGNLKNDFYIEFNSNSFITSIIGFILMNLPTLGFLLIPAIKKKKRKQNSELNNTKINDLE